MTEESHPPSRRPYSKRYWGLLFGDIKLKQLFLQILITVIVIVMYQTWAMEKTDYHLKDAMAKIRELENKLDHAQNMIDEIEANKTTVDQLIERVEQLEKEKSDRTEFEEVLSGNATSLRETTSAADEDIRQELSDRVDSSKLPQKNNQDHLSFITEQFASIAKATEFYQDIEELHNTTQDIQDEMLEVALNMTNLAHDITSVNVTLAMKADKRVMHRLIRTSMAQHRELVNRVDVLEKQFTVLNDSLVAAPVTEDKQVQTIAFSNVSATGVSKREFVKLSHVVHDLSTLKANQTSVGRLRADLQYLNSTTAKQWQLDGLKHTVEKHHNSTKEKHKKTLEKLEGKIKKNRERFDKFSEEITAKNNATQTKVNEVESRLHWVLIGEVVLVVIFVLIILVKVVVYLHDLK